MQIYLIFDLININDKSSPWDQDQIGIKSETQHIIYQNLANFLSKKDIYVNRLEKTSLACKCVFYRTKQNAKGDWIFKVLKGKNKIYQLLEPEE